MHNPPLELAPLTLFVLGVLTDDHHAPATAHNLARITDLPHGTTDFHLHVTSLLTIDNPPVAEIIRRELDDHFIPEQDFNIILTNPPGDVTQRFRAVLEAHTEHRVWVRLDHLTTTLNKLALANKSLTSAQGDQLVRISPSRGRQEGHALV